MGVWISGLVLIGAMSDHPDPCCADACGCGELHPECTRLGAVHNSILVIAEQDRDCPHFVELGLNGCARPRFDERETLIEDHSPRPRNINHPFTVAPLRPSSVPIIYALCSLRI